MVASVLNTRRLFLSLGPKQNRVTSVPMALAKRHHSDPEVMPPVREGVMHARPTHCMEEA